MIGPREIPGPPPLPTWVTLDGHEGCPEVEAFLREARPLGVILFARHMKSRAQVRELNECVRGAFSPAPLVAVDQEGGRVSRLRALGYQFAGASETGPDPAAVRSSAFEMGSALAELGFQVDFAPVADLGPAEPGTGLEGRVYGEDPTVVTRCCEAFLEGLGSAGLLGCLKHFPGLGGSRADSHMELPRIGGSLEERSRHMEPYRLLSGLAPLVMVAHGDYEFLGPGPSSLNPATYAHLQSLGFSGLAVTDDLRMGAVAPLDSIGGLAVRSLAAGAHVALWVASQELTLRASERLRADLRAGAWAARLSVGAPAPWASPS